MGHISNLYKRKFLRKVEQYNKPLQLPDYFGLMIGDKKRVLIAEIGSGPVNTIGNYWPGVVVFILASDNLQPEYKKDLWDKYNLEPLTPIQYQDFEQLTYPDNLFDIVHCRNALDHTSDIYKAIEEMKRVCKPGGWVYLAHAPGQKRIFGGHHFHNFEEIDLPGFVISEQEGLIIATWQKT